MWKLVNRYQYLKFVSSFLAVVCLLLYDIIRVKLFFGPRFNTKIDVAFKGKLEV